MAGLVKDSLPHTVSVYWGMGGGGEPNGGQVYHLNASDSLNIKVATTVEKQLVYGVAKDREGFTHLGGFSKDLLCFPALFFSRFTEDLLSILKIHYYGRD